MRYPAPATRALAAAAAALAAGCVSSGGAAFEVDGAATVLSPQRGTVVALWEIRTTPDTSYFYKYGEGLRDGPGFTLGWDADPPADAIGGDGIGVAFFALLPDATVVPDGMIYLDELPIYGLSADHAVVYKTSTATATGPAWGAPLLPRFSCVRCVRSQAGTGDSFELTPCANVTIGGPTGSLCDW
jgi:hypothetical protein